MNYLCPFPNSWSPVEMLQWCILWLHLRLSQKWPLVEECWSLVELKENTQLAGKWSWGRISGDWKSQFSGGRKFFFRRSKVSIILANFWSWDWKFLTFFRRSKVENPLWLTFHLLIVLVTTSFFRRPKVEKCIIIALLANI